MKVAFTICSNNYLAKAKAVADTFLRHNTTYVFYIFLVDTIDPNLDYKALSNYTIIPIKDVFPNIEDLAHKYNIIELNTAIKPFIFNYLFATDRFASAIYLDPDLLIFDSFLEIDDALKSYNAIITPHFYSPIDDGKYPSEIDFTPFGLYNLGFIAVKKSSESLKFLNWWHLRLMKYCYINTAYGMFTDQLWINYAPLFFEGFLVIRHLGYNLANWNLYERQIEMKDETYWVNRTYKLKFIHFSNYDFNNPYIISKYQNRHVIEDVPEMKRIIDQYQSLLISNNQPIFEKSIPFYKTLHENFIRTNKEDKNNQRSVLELTKKVIKKLIRIKRSLN